MSVLERICAFCPSNSILELELNSFTRALDYFNDTEKYKELLSCYIFDEDGVSDTFNNDLVDLIARQKVLYNAHSDLMYISMLPEERDKIMNENNDDVITINNLLRDYRKFCTKLEEQKTKKL